jgi:hypothetical protein
VADFCENVNGPSVSTECSFLYHFNDFQGYETSLTSMRYCRKYVTIFMKFYILDIFTNNFRHIPMLVKSGLK